MRAKKHLKYILQVVKSVCNFQSMKSPVKLNSLFSKFACYMTWFLIVDATVDDFQTRPLSQVLLFLRNSGLTVQKLQTETVMKQSFYLNKVHKH